MQPDYHPPAHCSRLRKNSNQQVRRQATAQEKSFDIYVRGEEQTQKESPFINYKYQRHFVSSPVWRLGGHMKASSAAALGRRFRTVFASDLVEYSPTRWLTLCGFALMAAIAVGTALTIAKFRESAIETGKQGLESAVLLLARHFDQQLDDFSILQKDIISELQVQEISQPDIFKSEMGTLEVHEILRAKVGGWADLTGINLFDSKGALINSSQNWPVPDINISDRAYFRTLIENPMTSQTVDVVQSRFAPAKSIIFSRKFVCPHGEFLGVLTSAMRPETLESFF
jgi:hypothetical protein